MGPMFPRRIEKRLRCIRRKLSLEAQDGAVQKIKYVGGYVRFIIEIQQNERRRVTASQSVGTKRAEIAQPVPQLGHSGAQPMLAIPHGTDRRVTDDNVPCTARQRAP